MMSEGDFEEVINGKICQICESQFTNWQMATFCTIQIVNHDSKRGAQGEG